MSPSRPSSSAYVILGAGPAGLGAATQLREQNIEFTIYERQARALGRCKSHEISGIFFDEGPHISFTKSKEVQALFERNTHHEIFHLQPKMSNFWKGSWIPHPVQSHLAYLPDDLKNKILAEIEKKATTPESTAPVANFQEWLEASFGPTFFREFSGLYTQKYWTTEAKNMTTDWVGNRISRPDPSLIREGATVKKPREDHYFNEFRYPKERGYQSFLAPTAADFANQTKLSSSVTAIHPKEKWVEINGNERIHYEKLISSIPLDLVPSLLIDAPTALVENAKRLHCSSVTLYNIIFRTNKPITDHFAYVYDEEIPFARYYFPKSLIERNQDSVQGVQAEVYSSALRPRDPLIDNAENVLRGFEKMKLFLRRDVIDVHTQSITHANVIFDKDRTAARDNLIQYLQDHQIYGVGRYGSWRYLWSDESYLDGKNTIRKILTLEGTPS